MNLSGKIVRVENQRLPLAGRAFRKTILLGKLQPNQMIHQWILTPETQRLFAGFGFAGGIAAQMRQHGLIGPGFRMPRIDLERAGQRRPGLHIFFGVDQMIRQLQQAGNMVFVFLQRHFQQLQHLSPGAGGIGARLTAKDVGIVGEFLQRFGESLGGEGIIMFIQRQFASGQVEFP